MELASSQDQNEEAGGSLPPPVRERALGRWSKGMRAGRRSNPCLQNKNDLTHTYANYIFNLNLSLKKVN